MSPKCSERLESCCNSLQLLSQGPCFSITQAYLRLLDFMARGPYWLVSIFYKHCRDARHSQTHDTISPTPILTHGSYQNGKAQCGPRIFCFTKLQRIRQCAHGSEQRQFLQSMSITPEISFNITKTKPRSESVLVIQSSIISSRWDLENQVNKVSADVQEMRKLHTHVLWKVTLVFTIQDQFNSAKDESSAWSLKSLTLFGPLCGCLGDSTSTLCQAAHSFILYFRCRIAKDADQRIAGFPWNTFMDARKRWGHNHCWSFAGSTL